MLNTQFSPWPSYTEEEANAIKDVLLSNKVNYWTGKECREFESEFAEFVGVSHAIALSNGTVALDVALKALNVGEGDEVIVTPRTFLASVSSVVNTGATPVFADIDLNSQNIEADSIEKVISKKTKAVIVVHLSGMPADMDPIMDLSRKHGFYVIEDCAQAHGAKYKGKSVGSIGHVGAWSFCQDKIMTTGGEGGMVTTNDHNLWNTMWSYKDHGKCYDTVYNKSHPPGFRWIHNSFGTNWRMTEIQAVIGRIQLKRMEKWGDIRRRNSELLDETCSMFEGVKTTDVPNEFIHARYKYYLIIEPSCLNPGWSRDKIIDKMVEFGVPCYQGSCSEVYLEKAFDNCSFKPKERLKNAKLLGERSVMLLVHPTITDDEIRLTQRTLENVLKEAFQ